MKDTFRKDYGFVKTTSGIFDSILSEVERTDEE